MAISETDERNIFVALAEIKAELRELRAGRPTCAVHDAALEALDRRVSVMETAAGKEKFVTAVIAAVAASLVLLAQYLFAGGGKPAAGA